MAAKQQIKVYNKMASVQENAGDNFIDGVMGVNKTGKSSTQKKVAQIWRDTHDSSMQIWGYDYQKKFGNLIPSGNHIDIRNDKDWALKCCKLRNGLLILDELKMGYKNPQHPPPGLETLFSQCCHWNLSILWSCHNPAQAPEVCTIHTNIYHIFLMYFKKRQFTEKIPNAWICITAANQVRKYVKLHGKGYHKLDPNYRGQGHPYIIVNMDNQTTKAVNMNQPF